MKRPTELEIMKRLLYSQVDNTGMTRTEANNFIYESVTAAYTKLDENDRFYIDQALERLDAVINRNGFGKASALELLASVAPYMRVEEK